MAYFINLTLFRHKHLENSLNDQMRGGCGSKERQREQDGENGSENKRTW